MRQPTIAVLLLVSVLLGLRMAAGPETQGLSNPPSAAQARSPACQPRERSSQADFELVMRAVKDAWKEGNARKAADCFTEDAIFSAPPSPGRQGRESLFQYFGGEHGSRFPMHIEWHHLVFDPSQQIGGAEYTLQYRLQAHGVVMIKLSHGLISNWREYDVASNLNWDKFVGSNRF